MRFRVSWRLFLVTLLLAVASFMPCYGEEISLEEWDEFELDEEEISADHEEEPESAEGEFKDKEGSPSIDLVKTLTTTDTGTQQKDIPSTAQETSAVSAPDLQVIQLTSRRFNDVVSGDDIWLIEFYADWCAHCTSFASTYGEIAGHFHSQPHLKVKIARVNVDQERALALRFGVKSFPSFYLIYRRSAYTFELPRSKKNLMEFVSGGFKKQESLPFYYSPMGPLGTAQGLLMGAGMQLSNVFYWLQETFGLSSLVTGTLMFGSFFVGCFFCIVSCAIAFTPKAKMD